jgi:hypothetical protein
MAELDQELRLALEEQGKSSSASEPTCSCPRSVEAPQDGIPSGERSETTGSRLEEPRVTQVVVETMGREAGKEELVGEGRVEMEDELAGQNKELERPVQQILVGVIDADDPGDKEATEVLLTT